ncbi:M56 family metallopeptidase [Rheinheimera soli]|uniref:Ankyrin repeat protein n=1 Tax=Rheinheimera soli TaxID=443616 RepID=A0ABU1VX33_9GAMM|nr:M56 family metallopeptidase [Rheinheimera soli]MDR7120145.1 ankyrin repeat protein [Rheinheimera soli]
MLEFSWLLFYLVLHLLLALVTVPWLYWLGRSSWRPAPHWMLRLWTALAVLLFVLPVVVLSDGAEQIAPQQWFNAELSVLQQQLHVAEATTLAETQPALTQRWALAPQLFYLFVPPAWWLLLVPLGCCWQIGRFSQSYRASRKLWLEAQPLSLPESAHHKPALYQHSAIDSAMLVGLRQPRIILPALWLQHLSAEQLQYVIAHERMHWHRGDLVAFYLQQLCAVLCWWSPVWGLICRQLNKYRELSCDAAVTAQLTQPHRYAQTLLDCSKADCSKTNSSRGQPAILAMPWQQQPLLAQRIRCVLQGSAGKITPQCCALVIALFLSVAASLVLAQRVQVAQLPAEYAQVSLTELTQLQQLLQKVRQRDLAEVRQLLTLGYPLNAAMPGEGTALMLAVRAGDKAMVELLLAAGADVNLSSRRDGNPLIIAAQLGNLELAQRLVQAGANVNAIVLADETPLINASYIGDLAMVQYLVQQGARVNLKVEATVMDGSELRSPLSRASTAEVRAYLLQQGATP